MRPEILTHPNIPKPLHGMAPREIKGTDWWNEQRQIAYAKYDYHCWACGVHKQNAMFHQWLEAHENYHINYEEGWMEITEITGLCHTCHNFIHSGRMKNLLAQGELKKSFVYYVLRHGFKILKDAELEPF